MTESTVLALGMALITAAAAGFAAWLSAKYGVKGVEDKVDKVHQQNVVQEHKIDETRREMNGKLHELISSLITTALLKERAEVAAKTAAGASLLDKAEIKAEKLLDLAAKVAMEKEKN